MSETTNFLKQPSSGAPAFSLSLALRGSADSLTNASEKAPSTATQSMGQATSEQATSTAQQLYRASRLRKLPGVTPWAS